MAEHLLQMTPEMRRKLDDSIALAQNARTPFSQDDFRLMLDAVAAAQIAGTLGQTNEQPLRDLYVKVAGLLTQAPPDAIDIKAVDETR